MKENKIDKTGRLWVNQEGFDAGVLWSLSEEENKKVKRIVLDDIKAIYAARFDKFPNLEEINFRVKVFHLDNLCGCGKLEGFHIADNGKCDLSFEFRGQLPDVVAKNLSKTSWCDLLKYRPDFFKQIPLALFEDKEFIRSAFEHVVSGMTDRVRVIEDYHTFAKKKAEDEAVLKEIKYRIGLARQTFANDLEGHKKMCDDMRTELFGLDK